MLIVLPFHIFVRNTSFGWVLEPLFAVVTLLLVTAYLVDGSFSPFLYFRF